MSGAWDNVAAEDAGGAAAASDTPVTGIVATVSKVTDPSDSRLAIYRKRASRDHAVYQNQVRALATAALTLAVPAVEGVSIVDARRAPMKKKSNALNHMDAVVGIHYSWECLRRLAQAREAGQPVVLDSVLAASTTSDELLDLAANLAPSVYVADIQLIRNELSEDGSSGHNSCNFVVAFPVQRPLSELAPPFLVLDGVGSAQNVGQILRTAYSLGISSVVASRPAWNCLNGRACRVSMGWMYFMQFHLAEPLGESLQELRERNVKIYAAEDHYAVPVAPHEPRGCNNWALVVGHEDNGISLEASKLSDVHVCVPQSRGESLNVAHAAAISLYELGKNNRSERSLDLQHDGRDRQNIEFGPASTQER